eukprot:CAMPEP_0116037076 /NCGR_PEP_ID=MMETSP0321-20121206/21728_1 /TAXON_ID=163516 /ORGANISM="Leptocylindrus danicus var. danicus, Strain B650" /LENGTH=375 /DNA_ID=CAMNT_0003514991 /DNA_START=107 /DNA_END=1231 /DNA_ORIENTATION=+
MDQQAQAQAPPSTSAKQAARVAVFKATTKLKSTFHKLRKTIPNAIHAAREQQACPICCEIYSFPPWSMTHCPTTVTVTVNAISNADNMSNTTTSSNDILNSANNVPAICYGCMYHHIMSIVRDRTSLRQLLCPCTPVCTRELTDLEIRYAIVRHHSSPAWIVADKLWLYRLNNADVDGNNTNSNNGSNVNVLQQFMERGMNSAMGKLYNAGLRPGYRRAMEEVQMYERWCIDAALARREDATLEDVVRCPTPDCNNVWLLEKEFRKCKAQRERSAWRKVVLIKWTKAGEDRKMRCGACHVEFCGLCRRPWSTLVSRKTHSGRSCARYEARLQLENANDYFTTALAIGARACPRCSIRVQRNGGCNHMTCVCGMEW